MPHPTASSLGSSTHQVSLPLSSSCRAHSSSASSNRGTSTASPPRSSPGGEMGDVGFSNLGLSGNTLRAIHEVFGFNELTKAQAQVLPELLGSEQRQSDFMVHARAGTGKTLSYLIPAVEHVLRRPPPGVGVLILAPSRELVLQITKDAEMLCTYHPLQVVPLIGGVRRDKDESMLRRRRPAIVVATLGKLVEHFESTSRFETLFEGLGLLVLDECDQLLSEQADILRSLLGYVPRQGLRQSLLLSATIPSEVKDLAARLCRPGYQLLDCVGEGVATQDGVEQLYAVCPGLFLLTALKNAIEQEVQANPMGHKVIVFFPTARLAGFLAHLFREQLKMRIYELHARCGASSRMVTQQEFQQCSSGILFTSGASERGMDYPNVSLVVQVLAPDSRQQYIHRVGRTARGGKEGRSVLLLLDREVDFLQHVSDLPLSKHPLEAELLHDERDHLAIAVSSAIWPPGSPLHAAATGAFASILQHYQLQQRCVSLGSSEAAVDAASEVMMGLGASEPPSISQQLAEELGLQHCTNLRKIAPHANEIRAGGAVETVQCRKMASARSGGNRSAPTQRRPLAQGSTLRMLRMGGPRR
ncbi:unnamed protein product [Polarella glacialis]|uniref:ATP-dependent RNA helicase n=1 Tax=Polarella glacialis TaxID=89957 RepID=A0A813DL09_POLGL|nr:unnamed protein product [Polarella glacialis]